MLGKAQRLVLALGLVGLGACFVFVPFDGYYGRKGQTYVGYRLVFDPPDPTVVCFENFDRARPGYQSAKSYIRETRGLCYSKPNYRLVGLNVGAVVAVTGAALLFLGVMGSGRKVKRVD